MTPERWQQLKALLDSALERKPDQRAAFLAEACGDDEALREELQSLLAHEAQATSFIEQPAFGVMAETLTDKPTITMLGRILGRYRIIASLGSGGMGEVYLAEDTQLGRKIALKTLPAHFTIDDERVRRFQLEARAASALNHPNIITIYEIGQVDSHPFIVTEFIEGETLRQHMAMRQMTISEALDVAMQLASALATAHQAGIVHRDIKPENIMVRADRIVKVLDFGLVKLTERPNVTSESSKLFETDQGMVMGTVHYMSPEQARGLAVDARTDIWSLGTVLFEMVGARLPFEGATSSDVIAAVLEREPTSLARYSPEAPAELEWIVKKALRKDREERYQTARELLSDLKGLKRRLEFEQDLERSADSGPKSAGIAWRPGYISSGADRTKPQSHGWESRRLIDSLAILPLTNASPDANLEYLSDGITESIINSLSQLSHIRVMARSSVFRYKGRDVGPKEIGRELGVRAVLTGRVLQVGERLVVGTELIDATDETQLWGKHYNRNLSDIFEVQEEIAQEISEALRLRLTGKEQEQLAKRYTENTEAYQLYLKGLHFFNKRSVEGYNKAIEYYQQAIEIDPNYALAYAGLADCYANCSVAELLPKDAITQARAAATRALEIDDTLAEAHNALAHLKLNLEWDWPGAETAFKRALELNPNYAEAHHRYSHYLVAMGRFEESLTESLRGLGLDPLDITMNTHLGWHYLMARQDDQAIEQLKKTLELDQSFVRARLYLGQAYERTGVFGKAIAEIEKVRTVYGPSQMATSLLGHAYAVAGKRYEAEKLIEELKEQSKREFVWPYHLAIIWTGLGEKDRAIEYLEKAYEERSEELIYLNVERMFDSLRSEPRFTNLVRRMGLLSVESIQPATSLTTHGAWHVSAEADRAGALSRRRSSREVSDSLAILPLVNNCADPNMDYLSDGITESLINALSKLTQLRVMAWSTVSRYKGREIDPRNTGRELNVRAVLTGRLTLSGEQLAIKTELVDVIDGSHLLGESYRCQPAEILDIGAEISSEISEKLLLRLTTDERKQLTKRYTDNVEAYHAYLRGRYCWNKRTDEGIRKAIEHFKQAIDNDPGYALAYSGLADSYIVLGSFGIATMSPENAFPKAREAALRALEIDDTLAEAHASLAYSLANYDWNWPAAEKEFKRCFELKPGYATAHHWFGFIYLTAVGLLDQAIAEARQALNLDPLSLPVSANVGLLLYLARRYDEAIDQLQQTLELDQNFVYSHWQLALAYEQKQMYNEAIAEFQKAISLSGRSALPIALLGHAYAVSGRKSEALAVLDQLSQLPKQRYVSPYRIAAIHAGLRDKDRAFQWLERAYQERDGWLIWLNLDPVMEDIRSDRRFTELLHRVVPARSANSETIRPTHVERDSESARERAAEAPAHSTMSRPWLATRRAKIVVALGLIAVLSAMAYLLLQRSNRSTKYVAAPKTPTFTQLTYQPGPEFFPSLSPDGKSLAYASRTSGNWDIYVQLVGGANPINLTQNSLADDSQPVFSPDGERVAFRSERDGGGIYLMGATGESVIRVSDFGYSPAWSPDSRQILVGTEKIPQPSTRPTKSQLWTINTRTNERRLITEGDALQPNCSPHGHRIAFWSRPSKIGQRDSIWTIPADGGDAVAVTDGTTTDSNPVWSPDGKFLYFSSNRGGSVNIWRVQIDEKSGVVMQQPEAVTTIGAATSALHLSFSRDGGRLAYIAQEEIRNLRKVSFDPSAGKVSLAPVSITRGSMQLWFPDVSPDGEWLTCQSMGNQRHIFIMRTDGSEVRDLTDDTFRHFWPRWSPDGKRIAFSSRRSGNYEIWSINRDGSGLQQLTRDPGAHYSPWSPDGKRIGYSVHVPKNECILFEPNKAWNEQKLEYLPPLVDASISFEGWSWSRNGRKLAGIRHLPNGVHSGIGIYDLESKNYDWFTDFGDWPVWLNDDQRLLFVSEGKIFLFDTRTRKYQQILTVTDQDVDIGSPGLSPDNRTLYFTFVAAEADIWLMTLE